MARPRRDVDDLRGEIQELFADLWQVPRFSGLRPGFRPQCDCFRTDDPPALHVVVEVPGVDVGSLEVVVSARSLVVGGFRGRSSVAGARYQLMEIEYGTFRRGIDLGEDVDPREATARYDNGMLRIVLPLARHAPQRATIPIEVERR
jgi:HSP20 family protein